MQEILNKSLTPSENKTPALVSTSLSRNDTKQEPNAKEVAG